jgi:hypothetical protein
MTLIGPSRHRDSGRSSFHAVGDEQAFVLLAVGSLCWNAPFCKKRAGYPCNFFFLRARFVATRLSISA